MIHIFSVFPGLFFLAPFSATLLRIAAAYAFLYIANDLVQRRHAMILERFPIVGNPRPWMVWKSATIATIVGCMLAVGLYTQVAAIVGMIISLKCIVFARSHASVMPLSRGTAVLLFIICTSLLFTGAGAVAFDLPL